MWNYNMENYDTYAGYNDFVSVIFQNGINEIIPKDELVLIYKGFLLQQFQ